MPDKIIVLVQGEEGIVWLHNEYNSERKATDETDDGEKAGIPTRIIGASWIWRRRMTKLIEK